MCQVRPLDLDRQTNKDGNTRVKLPETYADLICRICDRPLSEPHSVKNKTGCMVLCYTYMAQKICPFGEYCHFQHGAVIGMQINVQLNQALSATGDSKPPTVVPLELTTDVTDTNRHFEVVVDPEVEEHLAKEDDFNIRKASEFLRERRRLMLGVESACTGRY